ncbi:MAG: hypothetical protein HY865_16480 [Chloroflexi bacterium]|nr:hypothetical protein [Chloroflexota bacterium]
MDNFLQQGVMAAKAGDRSRAFDLLSRASNIPESSEQAWLWLSSVVGDDSERLYCLESVLKINPGNDIAKRGSTMLRQKGVIPAIPTYPEPQRASTPPAYVPSTRSSQSNPVPVVESAPQSSGAGWQQQDLSGLFEYAAMELAANKPNREIEKSLLNRGVSLETARQIINDAKYAVKKARREKYKKRMTRGFSLIVVGVIITGCTFVFADSLGGKFVLFYGAIIFGVIDFVVGLVGWIVNA